MQAEQLVALAAAHGVDLQKAARQGTAPRDVISHKVNGHTVRVLIEPPTSRARGTESRMTARPTWTTAEIAQACVGVPDIEFRAALFAFAGDRGCYWKLVEALFLEALALQARHHWPHEVKDIHGIERPYLKHLAKLTLDEDSSPQLFRTAPQLYSIYLHVSEKTWDREVAERFNSLRFEWLRWIGSAAASIQARLRDDSEE